MQILWTIKASAFSQAQKVLLKGNTKISKKSIRETEEAQYLEEIVQDTSIIWVLFLVVVDIKILLKEIELLLESGEKGILLPMLKVVSLILYTPWKTKQQGRMLCQLFNKITKEVQQRILRTTLLIIAPSKNNNQLKKESECKQCCSGIEKTRSSGSSKKSRWTGSLQRCSVIKRGRTK